MNRLLPFACLAACLSACDGPSDPPPDVPSPDGSARSLRRMDIDQLDASLRVATGVTWTEVVDGETVSLFEKLQLTLGKPDYKAATEEDLAPGLLFHKFLDDAANAVCTEVVNRERFGSGTRYLLQASTMADTPATAAAAIDADLARAVLVFHGRTVTPGDAEHARWRWLLDGVFADTGEMTTAWRAVCVALITHPAFYAY